MKIANYWKTVVAIVGAGVIAVQSAITDDVITSAEWVTIALALLAAAGVWQVPNKPAPSDGQANRPYRV
jgi:hypothetical protein